MLRKFLHVPPAWGRTREIPPHENLQIPTYAPEPVAAAQDRQEVSPVDSQFNPSSPAKRPPQAGKAPPSALDWLVEQQSLSLEAVFDCTGFAGCLDGSRRSGSIHAPTLTGSGKPRHPRPPVLLMKIWVLRCTYP